MSQMRRPWVGDVEAVEAVAAVAHHLAGLADIAELLGELQQCQFGDPLGATLSRRWGLRTNAPWREHFPLGEVFAADPRPDPRTTGREDVEPSPRVRRWFAVYGCWRLSLLRHVRHN